jgi:hypothetical protein
MNIDYGKKITEQTYHQGVVAHVRCSIERSVKITHRQDILTELLRALESLDNGTTNHISLDIYANADRALERLLVRHDIKEEGNV